MVALKTLRRPHMVRHGRLLMTAPVGECGRGELWLTCLKKENYPILGDAQCVPAGIPRAGESPHFQTICKVNADFIRVGDSEVDLKGGFPLPADTLDSNVLSCCVENVFKGREKTFNTISECPCISRSHFKTFIFKTCLRESNQLHNLWVENSLIQTFLLWKQETHTFICAASIYWICVCPLHLSSCTSSKPLFGEQWSLCK